MAHVVGPKDPAPRIILYRIASHCLFYALVGLIVIIYVCMVYCSVLLLHCIALNGKALHRNVSYRVASSRISLHRTPTACINIEA